MNQEDGRIARNLYSEEAIKVLYTDPENMSSLTDIDVGRACGKL